MAKLKTWKVYFSAVLTDDTAIESENGGDFQPLYVKSSTIGGTLSAARKILSTLAEDNGWRKWAIWDVGIMDQDVF